MSCYPPTPAFGNFSFAPPKPAPRSKTTEVSPAPASSNAIATADARRVTSILPPMQRPLLHSKPDTFTAPLPERFPFAAMNTHDESSDGLEEGELSEPRSLVSPSSNGVQMSGDEGMHLIGDNSSAAPSDKWNSRPRPSNSSLPQQNRTGGGKFSSKNDRHSTREHLREPRMVSDRGKGLIQQGRRSSSIQCGHDRGQASAPQSSSLCQDAQAAILDMSLCGVTYHDLIREGFDPSILATLFATAGLPFENDNIPPLPDQPSNEQGSSITPKVAGMQPSRSLPAEKAVLDKDAQMLREKLEKARHNNEKRELREKEQKEAEARAADLVRRRLAATQEQERRRREVEVKAKQDIAKKKIATMIPAKAASPSAPPTPLSSTPVITAVSTMQSQPSSPKTAPSPPMVIPGLLLTPTNEAASETALKAVTPESADDVVMSDAPPTVALSSPAAMPVAVPAATSGSSQPQLSAAAARRKRPMASDLYTEPSPMRRKFGAQRTDSMIIELSDDEDEAADAPFLVPFDLEGGRGSPLGTSSIASNGLNHGARRTSSLPVAVASSQADELRKWEADIQRMKAKIMAAERRKELSRAASNSGHPTPVGTPTVGFGPSVPPPLPSQSGAGKHDPVKPAALSAELTKNSLTGNLPSDSLKQNEGDTETQKTRVRAIEERMKKHREEIAAAEKQRKGEAEAVAAKAAEAKKEDDREKKRRELVELENRRQNKRLEREMLEEQLRRQIAQMRQEEEDIEQRHDSLAKDLENANIPMRSVAPSNDTQSDSQQLRMEIEVLGKNEGQSGTEELVERQLLVEDVSNSKNATPAPTTTPTPTPEGNTQSNGQSQGIVAMAKYSSPIQVTLPTMAQTTDSMDVDEPRKSVAQDKPASEGDVEMEISSAEGTSSGEDSVSDDSSGNSSSEEDEGGDQVMGDKPKNTIVQTAVSVHDAKSTQAVPHVASPPPTKTDAPATEPARAGEPVVAAVSAAVYKSKPMPNTFVPYQSPLEIFKSFRHHPEFHELKPDGLRSLQYSNNVNPDRIMCKYEVCGGVCNDRECEWQHFREIAMNDDQILVELAANEGTTEEEKDKFIEGLRHTILHLKQQGIMDFTMVAKGISAFRREFFGDETRVVKLNPTAPF